MRELLLNIGNQRRNLVSLLLFQSFNLEKELRTQILRKIQHLSLNFTNFKPYIYIYFLILKASAVIFTATFSGFNW